MFNEDFSALAAKAKKKITLLENNPLGYFLSSALAGIYVGLSMILIFTIGGLLNGAPYTKVVMGASFGISLSLVLLLGADLFTGNNFIMAGGLFSKTISFKSAVKLWVVCYIGNWIGSVFIATLFYLGDFATGAVGEYIATSAASKMNHSFFVLFIRGVLCNILVCLAVWSDYRCKSESGKLIMIFWCLFAFITSGFEHSVANMTLFTIAMLAPFGEAVSMSAYLHNIMAVTLGNMVGGILFVALPYYIISRKSNV